MRLQQHRQARRYTLRILAATREVVLTIPPRGTLKKRASSRRSTAAGSRRGWGDCLKQCRSPTAPWCRCAACRTALRIAAASAARYGPSSTPTASGCCACAARPRISTAASATSCAEAKRELEAASRRHAAELGVTIKRVAVRDQASRWGSCSTSGALSYSWRLILAPSFVLNYLAAHEVAHLVEMNHSPRFWRLVQRLCPGHERAKVWLDVNGSDLHRYGLTTGTAARAERLHDDWLLANVASLVGDRRGTDTPSIIGPELIAQA